MIPSFSTGGVLTAPPGALITGGYVPGNTLAAQHVNWILNHLTLELNNVLTAGSVVQNSAVDNQLATAIANLIAAYHDATKAPFPQAAAGVGQDIYWASTLGGNFTLPAGGIWEWWCVSQASAGGVLYGGLNVGINSGGVTVVTGGAGFYLVGKVWRLA